MLRHHRSELVVTMLVNSHAVFPPGNTACEEFCRCHLWLCADDDVAGVIFGNE